MKNSRTVIKNGHLVDPKAGVDKVCTLILENERVAKILDSVEDTDVEGCEVIDASGLYVFPGFIDLHVHFREPGLEYKETIETGAKAAAAGGFTTVCAMPNTKPVIDSPELVKKVLEIAQKTACINVLPIAAVTLGQNGTEPVDIEAIKEAGAIALSEDGKSVDNPDIMKQAMERCKAVNMPIFDHCEDKRLLFGGVMNKGKKSEEMGLPGISNEVEDAMAERDIKLAAETGVQIHLCHCSTEKAPKYIKEAKEAGVRLTAETGPHYFSLCDDDIPCDDAKWKMNPPLRGLHDKEALLEGVKSGVIDVIATDHAPHGAEEKANGFAKSPFGIVGLETSFPVSYTTLVKNGGMPLNELITRMSAKPAEIIHIDRGTLAEGSVADIVIADLSEEFEIDPETFKSKGRNTPYGGMKFFGKIKYTFVGGTQV